MKINTPNIQLPKNIISNQSMRWFTSFQKYKVNIYYFKMEMIVSSNANQIK